MIIIAVILAVAFGNAGTAASHPAAKILKEQKEAKQDIKDLVNKKSKQIETIVSKRIKDEQQKEKERKERIKQKKLKEKRERERKKEESKYESLGECRITTYCPACNDPAGSYQSSSGATLYEGCVACNWLDIGTKLLINGQEYTVMDTCGTDAIDIFIDSGDTCYCSENYYTEVKIIK